MLQHFKFTLVEELSVCAGKNILFNRNRCIEIFLIHPFIIFNIILIFYFNIFNIACIILAYINLITFLSIKSLCDSQQLLFAPQKYLKILFTRDIIFFIGNITIDARLMRGNPNESFTTETSLWMY